MPKSTPEIDLDSEVAAVSSTDTGGDVSAVTTSAQSPTVNVASGEATLIIHKLQIAWAIKSYHIMSIILETDVRV